MNLLVDIIDQIKWIDFLNNLQNDYIIDKKLCKKITNIIDKKIYITYSDEIISNLFFKDKARKLEIPKLGSDKKRIVYSFNEKQNIFLKFLNYLLRDYDYLFTNNLFSYRSNIRPVNISRIIHKIVKSGKYYAYKVDIHDYFRSINKERLMSVLRQKISDVALLDFFEKLLNQNEFNYNGQLIKENAGALPGVPISGFFANVYLSNIDKYFWNSNVKYFRYADDIIIFAKSTEELENYINELKNMLYELDLTINSKKEFFYSKDDSIEFLGVKYHKNMVDVSDISFIKIKGKIRRSARSFRRWMLKKNVSYGQTLFAFNKKFNDKFYSKQDFEICWAMWYFPIINTAETLMKIDNYYQQEARYIKTGRHNKMNYKEVDYNYLKKYHYNPLVSSYYEFKKSGKIILK